MNFKANNIEEAKKTVLGECNNINAEIRWEKETPLFSNVILKYLKHDNIVLDYGVGVGRVAKELLKKSDEQNLNIKVIGVDNSKDMLDLSVQYVNHKDYKAIFPDDLNKKVDFIYSFYCFQHIPAIEIREALQKIYNSLKNEGLFFYCSSDYRMAVRFDQGSFFDDRFLGVNLQKEVLRYFKKDKDMFSQEELDNNSEVKRIILGKYDKLADLNDEEILKNKQDPLWNWDESHPAIIYKKKEEKQKKRKEGRPSLQGKTDIIEFGEGVKDTKINKLILKNRLSPGDILVMTAALRALHNAYPGQFITDVDSPCPQIFDNSPYITKIKKDEADKIIDMQYPEIHKSGISGKHFSDGHRLFLAKQIDKPIPQAGMQPDIFFSSEESKWKNPLNLEHGYDGKYWVINAGSKNDYILKQYYYYQEVVNLLKDKITLVQIGQESHNHEKLDGVYDMVGKTDLRKLFRLIRDSEGVITCVSLPMHIAAAFKKPCVVVALGREGPRWEMYPNHRYLHTTGCLDCCKWDGCWKNKLKDCVNLVNGKIPKCQELITPGMIADAVRMYYNGRVLKQEG